MLLSKLYPLLPCLLCGESRAAQHRLCQDCWATLPWQKQTIQRQGIDCFVSCHYQFPINRMLHAFKDQSQLHYLDVLAGCLLQSPKPRVQAIIPMPISTAKLIARGFNQTYLLAQALAKAWQIPIWQPISRHDGHSQRGLDRSERLHNLTEVFYPNTSECRYKHVLIMDDVITTGATLAALQAQLQQLGCTHIQALCLCDATR